MAKHVHLYTLLLFVSCTVCVGQNKPDQPRSYYPIDTFKVITSHGPIAISRNIRQDKNGNIWIAAFDGVYRYDTSTAAAAAALSAGGKSFTNVTNGVSSARFFDVLEDRKGNFWFSTVGSGVYYYDPSAALREGGKVFQNFTTKDGLATDIVTNIYEDKSGNIWFGASRYDGKSFQTYVLNEGLPDSNPEDNDVNSVIEDKTGKFWFGTRNNAFIYDPSSAAAAAPLRAGGKKFTVITHDGEAFTNVRKIIEDSKGNIWLAGMDGLWRYNPSAPSANAFTNFTKKSTGYVYEDKMGNIWTTSQPDYNGTDRWALSRYDANTLNNQKPTVTDVMADYEDYKYMLFGILEANDGSIWFGSLAGVHRYEPNVMLREGGRAITSFKDK